MTSYSTKFIPDGNLIFESSVKISNKTLAAIDSSILAVFKDRAISGSIAETLRVLSSYEPKSEIERVARSMMILLAYKAEQASPGAGNLFLQLLSKKKLTCENSRKMLKSDLSPLLSSVKDKNVESLLENAIYQSGAVGNVSVSLGGITYISVDESASFQVIVSPSFENAKSLTSRKIFVYDGVIESVGQINTFLEKCATEKASVLLVARSFANEVASTIYSNNKRQIFDIVPLTPTLGIDGEFTILDIAAITNQSQVNKISFEESGEECNVIVESGILKITLKNQFYRDNLLKKLRKETTEFKNEDIRRLLGQRIARISSRRVSVCIGDEFGSAKEIMKEKFDYGMRSYLSSRRKGVIKISNKIFPGESFKVAQSSFNSFTKLLKSTGGSIVINHDVETPKRRTS